jgi:LmbE family N-acetylglucosaminyl deacetylase
MSGLLALAVREAAALYGVRPEALTAKGRSKAAVEPRQLAIYALRLGTGLPSTLIGPALGHADHSTVAYSARRAHERAQRDPVFRARALALSETLRAASRGAPAGSEELGLRRLSLTEIDGALEALDQARLALVTVRELALGAAGR